jgi:cytochrome c-type biogenesis protein CcmH
MFVFWSIAVVICALALWVLWRPLHNHSVLKMESIQQRNIAIANERALEIDSAFDAGDIDTEERNQARSDLEMALADELATSAELKDQFTQTSTLTSLAVLILVPVLAFGLYNFTSNYDPDAKPGEPLTATTDAPSLDEIISRLEETVNANPEDQQGLYLLAQSYSRLGRYAEAAQRFAQLIELTSPDADLLVSYADNSAMANDQIFTEDMSTSLSKALELNPEHVSGLWLSGLAEQQLGRSEIALRRWITLQPMLTGDPEASRELVILINDVSQELGANRTQKINTEFAAQKSLSTDDNYSAGITVKVSLSPELQSEVADNDSVFIFAKAKSGPPMPLAASRQSVAALPITVKLDDSMAMLPQMKLSSFDQVLLGARISKSGEAIPQPGDLESELVASPNSSSEIIELIISRRRP